MPVAHFSDYQDVCQDSGHQSLNSLKHAPSLLARIIHLPCQTLGMQNHSMQNFRAQQIGDTHEKDNLFGALTLDEFIGNDSKHWARQVGDTLLCNLWASNEDVIL